MRQQHLQAKGTLHLNQTLEGHSSALAAWFPSPGTTKMAALTSITTYTPIGFKSKLQSIGLRKDEG